MTRNNFQKRVKDLKHRLPEAMPRDRYRIRRGLSELRRLGSSKPRQSVSDRLDRLDRQLTASIERRQWRRAHLPDPRLNLALPIAQKADLIIETIASSRVVVIAGETGSGKTTQIPKLCLLAGRGIDGMIGCTQPRRIAAVTVAQRIAEEIGEPVGGAVGYKIRFTDRSRDDGFIKIMTDGILLSEAQTDRYLNAYDTIIVDEAHERSINIDFVLGVLRTLIDKRRDLKVIITSATIDTAKFAKAFNDAPIIEVSGRLYPVTVRYPGDPGTDVSDDDDTYVESAVAMVNRLLQDHPRGDILVFMPTEQDIRECCAALAGNVGRDTKVLPLYARLSGSDQQRVFASGPGRKIIVATNVAETSITIPGITYVVDTGLARVPSYNPRTRTTALPVVPISRSSADQRKGRCGRVSNGICLRLYPEKDYLARPLHTSPEILRANLADVILRMIALKLGDIENFPFIDGPAPQSIRDGFDLLRELGAIRETRSSAGKRRTILTGEGRVMARMPLDPRLARMLIQAHREQCLHAVAVIVAALSIQDPRERPADQSKAADSAHGRFHHPASDFLTLLNIWHAYRQQVGTQKSWNTTKRFCREHYLSFRRMREWQDVLRQIAAVLREQGLLKGALKDDIQVSPERGPAHSDYRAIHKSILSGFLSSTARRKNKTLYTVAKGREAMIFPGSGLFKHLPEWMVAAEVVETSRLFARTVAKIDSDWLEDLGRDLCRYSHRDPHWERKRGEVIALEQVTLFGLIVVEGRPVSYGPIAPRDASDMFIRKALVEGDMRQPFPFMVHNQQLIEEFRSLEDKVRRRDVMVSEEDLFLFYRERLPSSVFDTRSLKQWLRTRGRNGLLCMGESDLLRNLPEENEMAMFPDTLKIGEKKYACHYRYDPGTPEDGVTIRVPDTDTPSVISAHLDWLVPGLLREKITAMIRGLPKVYRKRLVPISDAVDHILAEMPRAETSLVGQLGQFIYDRFKIDIPASAWPEQNLPDHLKMRISILGPTGEELRAGRDAAILHQGAVSSEDSTELAELRRQWERRSVTGWDFGDLPEEIPVVIRGNASWSVYPGLEKTSSGIQLRLFQNRLDAMESYRAGVSALFETYLAGDLKHLRRQLALPKPVTEQCAYLGGAVQIEESIFRRVVRTFFYRNIRTVSAFQDLATSCRSEFFPLGRRISAAAIPVIQSVFQTHSAISEMERKVDHSALLKGFLSDIRQELAKLVPPNFVELYDVDRMRHIERYVRALGLRAQRGVDHYDRDRGRAEALHPFSEKLSEMLDSLTTRASDEKKQAVEEFFWLLEEYKVSLFTQELKTAVPVSKQRLEKKVKEIERMM